MIICYLVFRPNLFIFERKSLTKKVVKFFVNFFNFSFIKIFYQTRTKRFELENSAQLNFNFFKKQNLIYFGYELAVYQVRSLQPLNISLYFLKRRSVWLGLLSPKVLFQPLLICIILPFPNYIKVQFRKYFAKFQQLFIFIFLSFFRLLLYVNNLLASNDPNLKRKKNKTINSKKKT